MPTLFVPRGFLLIALVVGVFAAAGACTSHPLVAVTPVPEVETQEAFPIETSKKIDLLFVVDDSGSMAQEQAALALNFPRFMQALLDKGMPDLHIAVISTDVGAGGGNIDKCKGLGDVGRFQAAATCPLQANAPPFLIADREGMKNFNGPLTDAFACIATLGTEGCGYEHPLQSLRLALSNNNPHLGAFLRPEAHLGIIIISDEDDCSAEFDSSLFGESRAGESPNLRCATAGHVCGDRPVTAMAMSVPLSSCRPAVRGDDEVSRRKGLINIATFVDHVKAMKAPGRRILVSGIVGASSDANKMYTISGNRELDLEPICNVTGAGTAAPPIRLKAFVEAFGADGTLHSICGADLSEAMTKIGQAVAAVAPDTCLSVAPADIDPATPGQQVECAVYEQDRTATGTLSASRLMPRCTAGATARPCWDIQADAACTKSGTRLIVNRSSPGADGTTVVARCHAETN